MSEEVQETPGAAVRNYFGALGFCVVLIGSEMIAEKGGERVVLGATLVAAGFPIFLSAVLWR
jgi:hypothetical protein